MQKYEIHIVEQAYYHIASIVQYYYDLHGDYKIVQQIATTIFKAISSLKTFPCRTPIYTKRHAHEIRKLGAGRYLIFYTVNDDSYAVNVISVFHAKQDYEGYFLDTESNS